VFGVLELSTLVCSQMSNAEGLVSDRAAELFSRMHEQGEIDFDTAIGGYVVRIFNHVPEEKVEADMANLRKALEDAKEIRIANERALGRKPNEEALDAEIEANIAEMLAKDAGDGLQTFAARYLQKGDSYRIEQFALPNDISLDQLQKDLKNGDISFKPTYTRTWNEKQYAEISGEFSALSYDNRAAGLVKFTKYSRDSAMDLDLLETITNQVGSSASVVDSKTQSGDAAVILRVGSPKAVSVYLEITVLPTKGYCVQSAHTKIKGAVMSREESRGFVETSAGFWLPTKVTRESYRLDANQVPYLSSKEELIAFEPPKTNVPLADSTFDLASSNEFKALPQLTHLLPQGDPYIKKQNLDDQTDGLGRIFLILVNVFVVAALLGLWIYRRRLSRQ